MIKNRLFVMILALAMIMITACAPAAGPVLAPARV
jgi:hypothetical protein